MEAALGICALITSFHGFAAHLGVLDKLFAAWTGVWSWNNHARQTASFPIPVQQLMQGGARKLSWLTRALI